MINTILIANRGEVACRIISTCRRLGLGTVAVYSDADAGARHVRLADEAIHIGPSPAVESYLNVKAILAAARRAGAGAIHPGYGFLAENADFARACADAGLIFIGPAPVSIEAMGNKRAARDVAAAAGIPIIPGISGVEQPDIHLQQAVERIGLPLLVKAAAGGGGKGMRLVREADELAEALAEARREAGQAFGSDELMLERALANARHVEIQVLGDRYGNLIYLGERECSIQRRHQKIIEEAPAPALTPQLRQQMGEAAVALARAVNYHNAGTVEFLLAESGQFYFLEMNTRLQVEHPVTEMVTGVDLVEWQIRIAEGEMLPLTQESVMLNGHAIEARLYAENPANDFLPVTGPILLWQEPVGEGVRSESGIQTGDEVGIYYDPMLAKIIAHGPDRQTALRRLQRALATTVLLGITNNVAFLQDVLGHPAFGAGELDTDSVARHFSGWRPAAGDTSLALIAAALVQWQDEPQPATNRGYWRNNPNRRPRYRFAVADAAGPVEVTLRPLAPEANSYEVEISLKPETIYAVRLHGREGHDLALAVDGRRQRLTVVAASGAADKRPWWVQTRTGVVRLQSLPLLPEPQAAAATAGSLRAPMPGAVLAVLVEVGQRVSKGQALMKLEAMKMEHTIRTAADGVVEAIYFAAGDMVEADAQLIRIGDV